MQEITYTDAQLLRQMADGDEFAFRRLYDRYWDRIYRYTVRKVEFQEAAEEIVQDIFIDLWKRRESLLVERLESYLYRAARNRIVDALRANLTRKFHEASSGGTGISDSAKLDVEEELAYKELYSAILEGLNVLPEKTGEIFRLNRLEQLSAPEIADRLNVPVRTVEYHITHAIKTMRVYLRDFLVLVFILTAGS